MRTTLLLLLCLTAFLSYGQQFTSISQSITSTFEFVEIDEPNNVALIGGIRVGKSIDNGFNWTELNLGNEGYPFTTYTYQGGIIINSNVFCLVGRDDLNNRGKIIRTIDGGLTWTNVLESPVNSNVFFNEIRYNGSTAIVATANGIYRSTNDGLSWTYVNVPGFPTTTNPVSLNFNSTTLEWMAVPTASSSNYLVSSDNGITWSSTGTIFNSTDLYSVTNQDGNHLFTRASTNNTCHLFRTDQSHLPIDTISMIQLGLFEFYPITKTYVLANGEYLSHNFGVFFNILSGDSVYYYNHTMVNAAGTNSSQIRDIEIAQTYGLAVGTFGGLSRIDPSQPKSIWLPASFSATVPPCPNDTIFGSADYASADSWNWYLDGTIVSNSPNLAYPAPSSYGQHYLVLENILDGISNYSDTLFFNFAPLIDAPSYSISTSNSTPCFGDDVQVTVNFNSGDISNSSVEIWRGNSLIYGPSPAGTSNFTTTISNVTTQDTITLISSKSQTCGVTYDTSFVVLYPEADLGTFSASLLGPSVNCWDDSLMIHLTNTNSTQSFQIFTYIVGGSVVGFNSASGGADTTVSNTPVVNVTPPEPDSLVYAYAGITVYSANGCSEGQFYTDTIGFMSPQADFSILTDNNYYIGDTLQLSNNYVVNNRTWSVASNNLNVVNPNDTVPIIYGTAPGEYAVKLHNEAFSGCTDSMELMVNIVESIPFISSDTCFNTASTRKFKIIKSKLDSDGNIYYLGAQSISSYSWSRPTYYLAKHAPDGSLLWEKEGAPMNWLDQSKAVITDIDIANDTVYALFTIESDHIYNFDQIAYFPPSGPGSQLGKYLVKLDANTGIMLSYYDLNAIPQLSGFATGDINTSELLVDGNEIILSYARINGSYFFVTDLSLNVLGSIHTLSAWGPETNFVSFSEYTSNGNGTYDCHHAPQLKRTKNDEIIVVGYYGATYGAANSFDYNNVTISQLDIPWGSGSGAIFAARFNSTSGFTDFTKIAETQFTGNLDFFDVDKSGNISMVMSWNNTINVPDISIRDSVVHPIVNGPGTAVFQLDEDFNLNWYKIGKYSKYLELDVVQTTGDIIVSGDMQRNMWFHEDSSDYMLGNYYELGDSTTNPVHPIDKYILTFDQAGEIIYGKAFQTQRYHPSNSPTPYWSVMNHVQLTVTATPCGDIYTNFGRLLTTYNDTIFVIENDDTVWELENSLLMYYSDDCTIGSCQVICLDTDSITCPGQSEVYVSYSFNVDSVTYMLVDGNNQLDSGSVSLSQFPLSINIPQGVNSPQLIITNPTDDTLNFTVLQPIPSSYLFDSIMCFPHVQNVIATPSSSQYLWQGQPPYSDTFELHPNWYQAGYNEVHVEVIDSIGCTSYDTIAFTVDQLVPSNYSYDSTMCWDEVQNIVATPPSSQYLWQGQLPYSDTFEVHPNWYQAGVNEIIVEATDTAGCIGQDTLYVVVNQVPQPTFSTYATVPCGDQITFSFNSNDYDSITWVLNGNVSNNLFDSTNLQVGLNQVFVTLYNGSGCSIMDTIIIEYCDLNLSEIINSRILVYPNPVNTFLQIELDEPYSFNYRLVNSLGQQLFSDKSVGNTNIDMSYLTPGIYILEIETDYSRDIIQIVKE